MTDNIAESAAFIASGTAAGATISATVGGIGLVGGFGGIGIGMAPVAAAGGFIGAAAYGAFQAIGERDTIALGVIGIGAIGGAGVSAAIGGMGLSIGGSAVGIGMGTMAATGGIIGLGIYGLVKLIDKAGNGETPAQAFSRMEEKILCQEAYTEALLELELMSLETSLTDYVWRQKFAAIEVEDELKALKQQVRRQNHSYFNFAAASLSQQTFTPFVNARKFVNPSDPQENNQEPKVVALKVHPSQTWQCIQTIKAHSASINSITISADSQIIASASDDRTATLWNLQTGKPIYTFFGYSKEVYAVAISQDKEILVTGDFEQKVTRWNLSKKELIGTCFYLNSPKSHAGFVYSVAFSPDGKLFASGSADKTIRIWGRFTGDLKRTLNGHSDTVFSIAITPNGKILVSGSADKSIIIWNLDNGKISRILRNNSGWVTSVAISKNGKNIVSGSTDSTIKLWDIATGELIRTFAGEAGKIFTVAISPDSKIIAGGSNERITIWDLATGEILQTLAGRYPLAFSPDGKNLVTGSNSGKIKIWQQSFSCNQSPKEILLSGEWWEILEVEQNANREEVKRAYRNLARKYHPDLNPSPTAKVNMQKIVSAYKQYRRK